VTVIVETSEEPTGAGDGEVADTVKSVIVKVAVAVWTIVPLVPVIVTMYVAPIVELQVNVAVPDVVMLLGVMAPQVRFAGTVSVNETAPVNPGLGVTVIVEVAEVPTVTAAGEVADRVKSTPENVAVVEWDRLPLVPVIVTMKVPATAKLQLKVAVPELVMLAGVIAPQVSPDGTVSVRETVPVNPLTADTVIVEVADVPGVTPVGEVAAIVKSVTWKVAVVECESVPLVPVMVTT
jgi:hypothetical protein